MKKKEKSNEPEDILGEVMEGLRTLAFGSVNNAVSLLFAEDDENILEKLPNYNLYNVAEIKRPKGGGLEIKFFDRIKALEKMAEIAAASEDATDFSFYTALQESAAKLDFKSDDEDTEGGA